MFGKIIFRLMLAFIMTVLTCALMVGSSSYFESRKIIEGQVFQELSHASSLISAAIRDRLSEAARKMDELALNEVFQEPHKAEDSQILKNFVDFVDLFYNVYLFDVNGQVISMAYSDGRDVDYLRHLDWTKYNNSFPYYVRKSIQSQKGRFTESFEATEGRVIITYVAPVVRNGKTIAVLSCALQINDPYLQAVLKRLEPGFDGFVALLTSEGRVMAHSPRFPLKDFTFNMLSLQSGIQKKLEINEELYSYELDDVSFAQVKVLTAIKEKVISSLLERLLDNSIMITIFALLLSIVLSYFLAKIQSRPISELVKGLGKIRGGVYSERIEVNASGEVGEAIQAFNEMADQLQKRRLIEKVWIENWES